MNISSLLAESSCQQCLGKMIPGIFFLFFFQMATKNGRILLKEPEDCISYGFRLRVSYISHFAVWYQFSKAAHIRHHHWLFKMEGHLGDTALGCCAIGLHYKVGS